ncbi:MAG: elongation factor P [bacterium]|nr:elongation factor P [bacterium]
MLSHNDLRKGVQLILDANPYEVLEYSFVYKGRGSSIAQTKIKDLLTGNVLSKTFHPGDRLEEADVEKINVKFVYSHKGKFVFSEEKNPSSRFELTSEIIGDNSVFLKSNQTVIGIKFRDKIINISLPVKVRLEVKEAPPGIRGDRAQGGTKIVTLETGAQVNVPLFIEEGDVIEVNTEKGEYVKRVE